MEERKSTDQNTLEELLCPIRYTLEIVGGKWKLPILCILATGEAQRYNAIKRKLNGVTNMMLSQSLKELEAAGMVTRKQYNEIPPRVEYSLTEKGRSILPAIANLGSWGAENLESKQNSRAYCEQCQQAK